MRIIADCGSTSCKWIIEGQKNRLTGPGINPSVMSPTELKYGFVENIKLLEGIEKSTVPQINFYGAGCISDKANNMVRDWLFSMFQHADIFVESDLFGACVAVHEDGHQVAVGILGTGSAAAGFNGKDIARLTPSLGYQLADEGAGSDIGRRLLTAFLYGEMPKELFDAFYARFPETETSYVIEKVYAQQAGSAYLAQHTQIAVDYIDHPFIQTIIKDAFTAFVNRHMLPLHNAGYNHAGLIGSVGFGFKNILEKILHEAGFQSVKIVRDPLDTLPEKIWNNDLLV